MIIKPEYFDQEKLLFADSEVKITVEGHKYLGAFVGTEEMKTNYVENKVKYWVDDTLSKIANIYAQSANSAFVHGLQQ